MCPVVDYRMGQALQLFQTENPIVTKAQRRPASDICHHFAETAACLEFHSEMLQILKVMTGKAKNSPGHPDPFDLGKNRQPVPMRNIVDAVVTEANEIKETVRKRCHRAGIAD